MRRLTWRIVVPSILTLVSAAEVHAQCADGSAPPCSVARPTRTTAASVPGVAERARRFLILPFRNVTRQPEQDWLIEGSTTMLSDALARWQGITVVPDERLYPALKRAAIKPGEVADQASVRRVAEETGGWTAVTGEVLATGGRVRVSARAWDVPTNRELVRAASEIPSTGDVRAAFDSVSLRLLQSVGLDSVSADLANTTTRDLDAYRAYLRGLAHERRTEVKSALAAYEEATKRDTTFALAWARLADMLSAADPMAILQPMGRAGQASAKAVALSAKVPPRQRNLVLASNAQFRAQFTEARRLIEGVLKDDPNDVEALYRLSALEQFDPILVEVRGGRRPRGSPEAAARTAKRVTQLDPSRHSMFGMLASLYASAGVPSSTPTVGIVREPSSFPDLMQQLQNRQSIRLYYAVLRDSLVLVPAESLAAIHKDTLKALQKRARIAARAWGEQWLAVAGKDQAAPHQLMAMLLGYDDEYAGALRELAVAESIGIQTPAFGAPARRLVLLAKLRDYAAAARLSDSLATAGFFANPNNILVSVDAAQWSFNLHLLRGRVPSAQGLLQQSIGVRRMLTPNAPGIEFSGFAVLMGNEDPEVEPKIPRAFRGMQVDSVLARLDAFAASPLVGPWLPMILPMLAEAADTTKKRLASLLPVTDALAAKGQTQFAFYLASNAVSSDSTLEPEAARYPWYRTAADAFNQTRRARQARFRPGSATVSPQQAVFEWQVVDSIPFTRNQAETPVGRTEYRWTVTVDADGRYYRLSTGTPSKTATDAPSSGTLNDLISPSASRTVVAGSIDAAGVQKDTTLLTGVPLRIEIAPRVLRMSVNDSTLVSALWRTRPTHARFRFEPCVIPVGTVGQRQCLEERVAITYAP